MLGNDSCAGGGVPQNATALTSWAKSIRRTLDARGIDSAALFMEAGLDLAALDDPNARYPVTHTTRLWRLAVAATGDPCLGLAVASQVAPTTFHALGYSIMASANLREALQRIVRYFRIATDLSSLELRESADAYELIVHTPVCSMQPAPESVDAFISLLVRTARALAGRSLVPLHVALRRPRPPGTDCHERVLRAPVSFNAAHDLVAFARADCERVLDSANRELARRNDEIAREYLEQLDRATLSARVHDAILARLPQGEPVAEDIAAHLHVSLRSLQRHLADEDTSFDRILNETRLTLARAYLSDPRYAISEIAYLLGYADASCFTRAFRRWTGKSPSGYRGSAAVEP